MHEAQPQVKALTEELSSLWREVAVLAPKWAVPLTAIERAHRRLAERDAALPATKRTGRHRRRCVEALQADKREVEAQLAWLHSTTSSLTGLVGRHLEATRDALGDAAVPLQRFQCGLTRPWQPLWILCASVVTCFVHCLAMGDIPWLLVYMLAAGTCAISRIRFEFDGRSLRVSRRVLGVRCSPTQVVDLARFKSVEESFCWGAAEKGPPTKYVKFTVSDGDEEVELGSRVWGLESDRIGRQLREWCVTAGVVAA